MRVNQKSLTVGIALVLTFLMGVMPLAAEPGGPILNYLQSTIKPLLDSIKAEVAVIRTAVGLLGSTLASVDANVGTIQGQVARAGRVHTVRTSLLTHANSTATVNLDFVGALPEFSHIKRYTVVIHWGELFNAPAGVDKVTTGNGVVNMAGDRVFLVDADVRDPSGQFGVAVPPYAGVASYVQVNRGADGLGPVEVLVNAYIELDQ